MKKKFTKTGPNGSFTGYVEVLYKTETVTGTHAYTHDDYTKEVKVYKAIAVANGTQVGATLWLTIDKILPLLPAYETTVESALYGYAHAKKVESDIQTLKNLGYDNV